MCGIAGYLGGPRGNETVSRVARMLRALERRGPDGEGTHPVTHGVLGHRRLAIFDLSEAGRQPMSTPDNQLTIVFNGAIYNFLELRRELEQRGGEFHTRTDTEVLLLGYRQWGMSGLLDRLRGMFAFALWDTPAERLFLVRDRLGVKPLLFVTPRPGEIAFASTAAALSSAGFATSLDPTAMARLLQVGYVPDTTCIYRGIQKLPPATVMEWTPDRGSASRVYWESPGAAPGRTERFPDAVDRVEAGLIEAVRLRLHADVPVGCLLSGGVDSSLVAWAAGQSQPGVRVFTVGTPGDPADESPTASRTASTLGLPHEIVRLDEDASHLLGELIEGFDEPFPCSSAMGLLQVSRAIRPFATVLLTGDGGDEAFLGYPEYLTYSRVQRASHLVPDGMASALAPAISRALAGGAGAARRPLRMLDYILRGMSAVHTAQAAQWRAHWDRLAGPGLREASSPLFPAGQRRALLSEYTRHQLGTAFLGEYLPKVDRATMHYGLESRAPFLDHQLWSIGSALPVATRLHGGRTKAVLRALAARRIGKEVAYGRKRGFTIPVERWLVGRWSQLLDDLERGPMVVSEGWVSAAGLADLLRQARQAGVAPLLLWRVVVLEAWLRRRPGPEG